MQDGEITYMNGEKIKKIFGTQIFMRSYEGEKQKKILGI